MEYYGHEIKEKQYVPQKDEYYNILDYDDNVFSMPEEDLHKLLEAIRNKKEELNKAGVDYKNVHIGVEAFESHPDEWPYEFPHTNMFVEYERMETDEESMSRVAMEMEIIDKNIALRKKAEEAQKMVDEYEILNAKRVLKEHGYTITEHLHTIAKQ